MTGRALLNVVETDLLHGLSGEARDLMWMHIHQPALARAQAAEQKTNALLEAGGELG